VKGERERREERRAERRGGRGKKRELIIINSLVVLDDHVLKGLSDDLRTFINDRDWYTRYERERRENEIMIVIKKTLAIKT
jgi:hypothetical protein